MWLFRVARHLHAHLPAGEIVALLESRVVNCGRHVPRSEIVSAVQSSLANAWQPKGHAGPVQTTRKWPTLNREQREAIVSDGGGLADLREMSPWRIEDNARHAEFIIDRLFPPNALLCCGKSNSVFDTRPREAWRGQLSALQLIVPSPMSESPARRKMARSRSTHSPTPGRGGFSFANPTPARPMPMRRFSFTLPVTRLSSSQFIPAANHFTAGFMFKASRKKKCGGSSATL